jgi:uncharacterized protein YcbK (DUF882 family)
VVNRRRFIKVAVGAAACATLPMSVFAADWLRTDGDRGFGEDTPFLPAAYVIRHPRFRELAFYNIHTDERLRTVYFDDGRYLPDALNEINYFFRDYRANEVKAIDPRLLDALYHVRRMVGSARPIDLISGYRTWQTNLWLAARTEGVARHSMHIEGKAADIHIPGVELRHLQLAALALGAGGVGYYPRSQFVHMDTGRVRRW